LFFVMKQRLLCSNNCVFRDHLKDQQIFAVVSFRGLRTDKRLGCDVLAITCSVGAQTNPIKCVGR
jgi:hypothetical protein